MATMINYLEDLAILADMSGEYELGRDLDFLDDACYRNPAANKSKWTTGRGWDYIIDGAGGDIFSGVFDGKNRMIKNLYFFNGTTEDYGCLFGDVSGTIKNLKIDGATITASHASCICNIVFQDGVIDNCHITNANISTLRGAGIAELLQDSGIIRNCSFDGTLTILESGDNYIGGIVAYTTGTLNASFVQCCKSTGVLNNGQGEAGGIVGRHFGGSVQDCYSEIIPDIIINRSNDAIIAGTSSGTANIQRCWVNQGIRYFASVMNTVVGYDYTNNYNKNTDNYYDITLVGSTPASRGADGRTTAQMQQLSTFTNWDIVTKENFNRNNPSTWWIDENNDYPRLWWELEKKKRKRGNAAIMMM